MKKILFILLITSIAAHADERIKFKISKPLCVLTFLQAARGDANISPALTDYIWKHIPEQDRARLHQIVDVFSGIDLSASYIFTEYPESRQKPRNLLNLLTMAAVQTDNLEAFSERIIGILPNEQWLQLKEVLFESEKYYDKMIGDPYATELNIQLAELNKFDDKADALFAKLKRFYGSTWGTDVPFTVSIYPVPGHRGNTTATPHSNCLVMAVLTKEGDHAIRIGVALHEICHVLYDEQPLQLQLYIDSLFTEHPSPFAKYAYSYFDEAMATACGNGWAYKELAGKLDKTGWYNDEYINGYAHAIYPLVQKYIMQGKEIDKAFIDSSITLFAQTFPDATISFQNLLNKMHMYTDASDRAQNKGNMDALMHAFRGSSWYCSYPLDDKESIDMMKHSDGTQLIVIHADHARNFEVVSGIFRQLHQADTLTPGIICFYDKKNRPIIVVNAPGPDDVNKAFTIMAKRGKMEPGKTIPLE